LTTRLRLADDIKERFDRHFVIYARRGCDAGNVPVDVELEGAALLALSR
jgi:hypothetical protein